MRKTVGIDVDDVSGHFRRKFVEIANEVCNLSLDHSEAANHYNCEVSLKLTKEQEDLVWPVVAKKGFCTTLEVVEGAGEAIEALAKKYDIAFVTKPFKMSETWVSDRYHWILRHFGKTLADSAIFTRSKHLVDVDYFIDDRIDMVDKWHRTRMTRNNLICMPVSFIYPWPYNNGYGGPAIRVSSWESIVKLISV